MLGSYTQIIQNAHSTHPWGRQFNSGTQYTVHAAVLRVANMATPQHALLATFWVRGVDHYAS